MNLNKVDDAQMRELLRRYLIGTLKSSLHEQVEAKLSTSEQWRQALDSEREALSMLNVLGDEAPSRDLTAEVMEKAKNIENAGPAISRRRLVRVVQVIAAAACVCLVAAVLLPLLSHSREAARRSSPESNLRHIGIALKAYSSDSEDALFPPKAPYAGIWMFDVEKLYPEYLRNLSVLVSPAHPRYEELISRLEEIVARQPIDWRAVARIAAESYVYLPWAVTDSTGLSALANALDTLEPDQYDSDISLTGGTIKRLRNDVREYEVPCGARDAWVTADQAGIPVMFEVVHAKTRREKPLRRLVLYMDGHVEHVPYGKKFPATQTADKIVSQE